MPIILFCCIHSFYKNKFQGLLVSYPFLNLFSILQAKSPKENFVEIDSRNRWQKKRKNNFVFCSWTLKDNNTRCICLSSCKVIRIQGWQYGSAGEDGKAFSQAVTRPLLCPGWVLPWLTCEQLHAEGLLVTLYIKAKSQTSPVTLKQVK